MKERRKEKDREREREAGRQRHRHTKKKNKQKTSLLEAEVQSASCFGVPGKCEDEISSKMAHTYILSSSGL
jgi:hypothetical protein